MQPCLAYRILAVAHSATATLGFLVSAEQVSSTLRAAEAQNRSSLACSIEALRSSMTLCRASASARSCGRFWPVSARVRPDRLGHLPPGPDEHKLRVMPAGDSDGHR